MDQQSLLSVLEKLEWKSLLPYEYIPDGTTRLVKYSIFNNLSEKDIYDITSEFSFATHNDIVQEELLLEDKSNEGEKCCNDKKNSEIMILDRIKGCLGGLAIADSVGAPLEFLSVVSTNKIPDGKEIFLLRTYLNLNLGTNTYLRCFRVFIEKIRKNG